MAGVQEALNCFWTVVNQWKSGHSVELRLYSENGQLKVNLSANLGQWRGPTVNTENESDAGSRGYQGLWKASPSRQRRRDKRSAERAAVAASAVKATSEKKVTAKKDANERNTAEKTVLEKTAEQKSGVAKYSETEEVAITSTKHDHCAQTYADVVSEQQKMKYTKLCPYCSSTYKGVVSYSECCLCMDMGQAGCDCTCACDNGKWL